MKVIEFDVIFLSYDEPNADVHYADLCNKVPWAKRIHGVKGSDHAHKAAAEASETDWFITVDADNIVDPRFFNIDLDMSDPKIQVYGWCGRNAINGLRYGNGGLKIWRKDFVLNMKTHENSNSDRGQVDFCWEDGYRNFPLTFSESIITGSPFQAWRAGFREGVKMSLDRGVKTANKEFKKEIHWKNLDRLRVWLNVGADVENGLWAILGARHGCYMTNCTDWDYVQVRDFDYLTQMWKDDVEGITELDSKISYYGTELQNTLDLEIAEPRADASKFFKAVHIQQYRAGTGFLDKE